ncbi:ABC transporter ATP-binding protein [Flavobacteriaceae bacterium F08102]|nr:ABC transporter ATP-binding protein [Flavobacteriaceae bacterium F08102]
MKTDIKHTIQTRDLTIGYRTKKSELVIGSNFNVTLQSGKLVCLLGKNGIGKSTLLRTLSRLQPQLKGEIWIDQEKIEHWTAPELAQKISTVFTERIPANNLTVYELIALGRQPYTNWLGKLSEIDHRYINLAISQTQCETLLNKKHHELSDGQLQKVMIARSLAQNTPIITLDEPTAHLDMHHKISLFILLKQLAKKMNKAILVSTHEIHYALEMADELWLMNEQGITSGETEKLIKNNALDELFSTELMRFDALKRQFVFTKD